MGFALSDMKLTSSAFEPGGAIPAKYTGDGEDVSPALSWTNVPDGARSLALICHDPDAPLVSPGTYGFVHWTLYGIPGDVTELPEGVKDYVQGVKNADAKIKDRTISTNSGAIQLLHRRGDEVARSRGG